MPHDDTLFLRLQSANREELLELAALLKLEKHEPEDFTDGGLVNLISRELRSAAGNSVVNLMRTKHEMPYKDILIDVADKLTKGIRGSSFKKKGRETETEIEEAIYKRFLELIEETSRSMTAAQRDELQEKVKEHLRRKGVEEHLIKGMVVQLTGGLAGVLLGPAVTALLFSSFWTFLIGFTLGEVIIGGLIAGGPLGLILGPLVVLSGPSYRKTIPAVLRIIIIRKTREAEMGMPSQESI